MTAAPASVLVSSASAKAPLVRAVQDAARRLRPDLRVIAGDMSPDALTAHVADAFWPMPPTRDERLEDIIAGCRERGVAVVLPTRDGELAFWARHAARLEAEGIRVLVSPPPAVELCLDKLAFWHFGRDHGFPFIPTDTAPDRLGAPRLVVKERFGAGGHGLGLNLDPETALRHGAALTSPVYQPCVQGREISVDAWLDRNGRVHGLVPRRRDRVVGGESKITTTFRDPALEETLARILAALNLRGPVVLQAMLSPDGGLHVIECNARFGGASTAGIAAGLDSLHWSLREALDNAPPPPFHRIPGEVRQIRVSTDMHEYGPHF